MHIKSMLLNCTFHRGIVFAKALALDNPNKVNLAL